jgi:homoserine O-acetyltransferase
MIRRAALVFLLAVLISMIGGPPSAAEELIVEKQTFALPSYSTVAGETIKSVKVGWEAAGTLNDDKSNAILVTHYFSGTSHAFGKYSPEDKAPGYWDAIIGPGKAIDTNKYFVLSSDTLVNLNVNMPNVVTTGPASINPDTGKPYGMSFPVVSIKDFVRVEKALIDSLGIKKLKAVIGASMGGLQAYEWAQSYPDSVDRIVAVVAYATAEPYLIGWLDMWAQPIRLDPKWNGGDYYGKAPPIDGLKAALELVTLQANSWEWARKTHLERRRPRRAKTRRRRLPTDSRLKRSWIKRQRRAPLWPTPIISFICAKQINWPRSIRQRSKRPRSCFMRRTTLSFTSRLCARRYKRSPRPADRLSLLHSPGRTAISIASWELHKLAIKSRRFSPADKSKYFCGKPPLLAMTKKNAGPHWPRRSMCFETPIRPFAPRLRPKCCARAFPASGTG